ncbi:MAG: DUF4089 domain-containing protein [Leptolyngbya sp.]|nr:DUF4089 domain-containing protein [Leptolyngbya sp.]
MTNPSPPSPGWDCATYVEQTAALLGLTLPDSIKAGVVVNFERLVAIAQPVVNFDLTATDEPAPVFHPGGESEAGDEPSAP